MFDCFLERGHIRLVRRNAKSFHHGIFGVADIAEPLRRFAGEQIDFLTGDVGKGLQHLVIGFSIFYPVFFHITYTGMASACFEICFIFLPGIIIFVHFKLAFCKNNPDFFLYNVMFLSVNVCNNRGIAVCFHKFTEIEDA